MQDETTKWLMSLKPTTIVHKGSGFSASKHQVITYPPMNCDARFSLGKYKLPKPLRFSSSQLPEYWINNDTDNKARDALITTPFNQQNCGSCFAVSVATAMNDVFVFNGLQFNPNISALSMLACENDDSNHRCNGGNSSALLDYIEQNGISTSNCLDYTAEYNNYCGQGCMSEDVVNGFVPTECGCCDPNNTHYLYYTKNKTLLAANSYNPQDQTVTQGAIEIIKNHLLKNGTAITGYAVPKNFQTDQSSTGPGTYQITKGVYVETENYGNDPSEIPVNMYDDLINRTNGGHGVAIVGWGIEKQVHIPSKNVVMDLPYWIVRNSWGPKWGLAGYFHIAMYQPPTNGLPAINEQTAFERMHPRGWGGIICFDASHISPYTGELQISDCSDNNYTSDSNPALKQDPNSPKFNPVITPVITPSNKASDGNNDDNKKYIYIGVGVVVAIIILIFIILKMT